MQGTRRPVVLVWLALALGVMVAAASGAVAAPWQRGPTGLPSTFAWSSSGELISPKPDPTHLVVSTKDPSVLRYNDRWLVYATTANVAGSWSLVYTSFTDWEQAADAPHYYLNQTAIGNGYRAAPQLFYFSPQQTWYLVYQTGVPSYSTTTDPSKPETWSAPKNFQSSMPQIVRDNIGNGYWVDFWVICEEVKPLPEGPTAEEAKCHLFSSDDNGHLYRAETTVAEFPNGFDDTQIALSDPVGHKLYEGSAVHKIKGTDSYLLIVEAIGSDGRRYFRSWTGDTIDGEWVPLADTEANPFTRFNNVTFPDGAWTSDISHGELIRAGVDQSMQIDPSCLQFLYQGKSALLNEGTVPYHLLPWRLGLLTQTQSAQACG